MILEIPLLEGEGREIDTTIVWGVVGLRVDQLFSFVGVGCVVSIFGCSTSRNLGEYRVLCRGTGCPKVMPGEVHKVQQSRGGFRARVWGGGWLGWSAGDRGV